MRFGLIGQLDSISTTPHCYISKKQASLLLETGQCVYTTEDGVLRKTPKYSRLVDDKKIIMARCGALRGLSSQVGAALAEAVRDPQQKSWAQPMLDEIRRRVYLNLNVLPEGLQEAAA